MVTLATPPWLHIYSKRMELFLASRTRVYHPDLQNMSLVDKFPFLRASADGQTIFTDLDALYTEEEVYSGAHHQLDLFDLLMGLWIPGIICLFGIVGNLLCLWVLSRHHISIQGCSTFTSLKALAISDIVVLVGAILQQILPMLCEFLQGRDTFCLRWAGYIRVYSWPVVCIGQMTSIWTTVLVSAERFVAICASNILPPSYSYSRRNWRVILSITGIWIFSALFNIPRFFEFMAGEEQLDGGNTTKVVLNATSIRSDGVYRYFYNTFLFCVMVYAIPLSILTCLNVRLVRTIHKAKSSWTKLNRNQKLELKTTKLPLLIVLVFFVCETESFLAFLLDAVFVNDDHPWLQVYTAVVNLLVVSNSAVNFLLMFFAGGRFRKMLLSALQCRDKRPLANHSWAGSSRNMRMTSSNHVTGSSQSRLSNKRNQCRHRAHVSTLSFDEKEFDQNPGSEEFVSISKATKGHVVFQRKSSSNAEVKEKLQDWNCGTVTSLR